MRRIHDCNQLAELSRFHSKRALAQLVVVLVHDGSRLKTKGLMDGEIGLLRFLPVFAPALGTHVAWRERCQRNGFEGRGAGHCCQPGAAMHNWRDRCGHC